VTRAWVNQGAPNELRVMDDFSIVGAEFGTLIDGRTGDAVLLDKGQVLGLGYKQNNEASHIMRAMIEPESLTCLN